jgi:CheY-like chemotaxis protein
MIMAKLEYILLIDDSDADNYYHKIVINRAQPGSMLKSIDNSVKALEYLVACLSKEDIAGHPMPQLVFIDINMPALNGFELLDKLRKVYDAHYIRDQMKIFMLTGSLNPDDKARANELYADLITGFCIKPLSETVFKGIVKNHF